jgi:hypothetical protein
MDVTCYTQSVILGLNKPMKRRDFQPLVGGGESFSQLLPVWMS